MCDHLQRESTVFVHFLFPATDILHQLTINLHPVVYCAVSLNVCLCLCVRVVQTLLIVHVFNQGMFERILSKTLRVVEMHVSLTLKVSCVGHKVKENICVHCLCFLFQFLFSYLHYFHSGICCLVKIWSSMCFKIYSLPPVSCCCFFSAHFFQIYCVNIIGEGKQLCKPWTQVYYWVILFSWHTYLEENPVINISVGQ